MHLCTLSFTQLRICTAKEFYLPLQELETFRFQQLCSICRAQKESESWILTTKEAKQIMTALLTLCTAYWTYVINVCAAFIDIAELLPQQDSDTNFDGDTSKCQVYKYDASCWQKQCWPCNGPNYLLQKLPRIYLCDSNKGNPSVIYRRPHMICSKWSHHNDISTTDNDRDKECNKGLVVCCSNTVSNLQKANAIRVLSRISERCEDSKL